MQCCYTTTARFRFFAVRVYAVNSCNSVPGCVVTAQYKRTYLRTMLMFLRSELIFNHITLTSVFNPFAQIIMICASVNVIICQCNCPTPTPWETREN